jgi:transposase
MEVWQHKRRYVETAGLMKHADHLEGAGHELHFCYEADLTGYGLYRQLTGMGHA